MNKNNKVIANNSLLVSVGKSSRLTAIRNKQFPAKIKENIQQQFLIDLKPDVKIALQQACELIEERLAFILKTYPVNKKNTFFKLRYGLDFDKVKEMPMKSVFILLNLQSQNIRQFCLIKNLDCNGKEVGSIGNDE